MELGWGGFDRAKLDMLNIIEYGSTLYVGMTQKKNGGPIKRVQNLMFRTLPFLPCIHHATCLPRTPL